MDVKHRRLLTEKAIGINPTQIELKRIKKESDGAGGWLPEEEVPLPAQVFRLFISGSTQQSIQDVAKEGGAFQLKSWEMLCPWNADVQKDDTFELDGHEYRVVSVRPIRYMGEVISYQAVVEEVS